MHTDELSGAFARAAAGRRLLTHAFYRRWEDGQLTREDLGAYAGRYRAFERCLPGVLATVASGIDDAPARRLVEENLADELSRPRPHVDLFEGFARAVGAQPPADGDAGTGAMAELVALYRRSAADGPVAALAVLGAYELQAAEVAATKGGSLRAHYGLDDAGTEFWDVHAGIEADHAAWTVEALRAIGAAPADVEASAAESTQAWWAFLDERERALSR